MRCNPLKCEDVDGFRFTPSFDGRPNIFPRQRATRRLSSSGKLNCADTQKNRNNNARCFNHQLLLKTNKILLEHSVIILIFGCEENNVGLLLFFVRSLSRRCTMLKNKQS